MPEVQLFYLMPESEPSNSLMQSNDQLTNDVADASRFILELDGFLHSVKLERYNGYYDPQNISNFLLHFNILEDYYPNPITNLLRLRLQHWNNWREEPVHDASATYKIFGQPVSDHTFCEVAYRKSRETGNNFIVLNHGAFLPANGLDLVINHQTSVAILAVSTTTGLFHWFAENRHPVRNFQIIEKHGESRQEGQWWRNGEWASPLKCDRHRAFELLKTAIGDSVGELFNIDSDNAEYIVFKFEGHNPQNRYHGYHVSLDSTEVPQHIKDLLE